MTDRAILSRLGEIIETRKAASPEASYVASLFARGEDAVLKKIGEEAAETIIAAKGNDRNQIVHETADLWFHCLV
ncbi:MAG: phosphoribosyl-ATP diphosphatase, partial [Pseudomonadota bacterium]|nr:phosphoribosyl-ATP diphosphatase [Pseudomonadota bacterium]